MAFSQVLTRDPKHNREESNTEWKGQYTLYDYWNDEPILPDENGIYRLFYDLKPVFVVTSSQIHVTVQIKITAKSILTIPCNTLT